jgi:outer membrane protein OmpA-like peptidoglycan-associated protein
LYLPYAQNFNLSFITKQNLPVMSTNEEKKDSALGFLLPLLLLALLAAGAYYLLGTGPAEHEEGAAPAMMEASHEEATNPAATEMRKESLKVKLINGTEIEAYKGGIEDKLVTFLNTDYKALGADSLKNIWFDFDNLNFKMGSAELTPESQQQVDNMTAILKAYPMVKLKIGGYTDKVGDEASNKKLSGDRAIAVKNALTKAGVGAQITDAEGYGSAFAKHPADAPESERVTDRRVSVSVRI